MLSFNKDILAIHLRMTGKLYFADSETNGKHIPKTALSIPSAFTVWLGLIGHPFTALIIANLLAWYFLGLRQGMTKDDIQEIWGKSLVPAGLIILLTGAGAMLAQSLAGDTTTPIMFAFVCSVLVCVI